MMPQQVALAKKARLQSKSGIMARGAFLTAPLAMMPAFGRYH
jgi:hypothetical protein